MSQAPPSPLLNYWSLGVEEQFYIVYPAVFLFLAWWARRGSFRMRLTVFLVAVIVASYAYSIVFTASNAQSAYFSLLVRSWELALGALIAVHSRQLQRIPQAWAAIASWVGLAVILVIERHAHPGRPCTQVRSSPSRPSPPVSSSQPVRPRPRGGSNACSASSPSRSSLSSPSRSICGTGRSSRSPRKAAG